MKHVTFAKDHTPYHRGDKRLVPDQVAKALEEEGLIEPNAPDWPQRQAPTPVKTKTPRLIAKGDA